MDMARQKLKATLKEAHCSATQTRMKVFLHLMNAGPVSVGRLAQLLEREVDRATVYRTIDLFEKLGIINRIWHGFKHQVELSEIFTPHHHHAKCQNCAATIDIGSPELESAIAQLTKQHHFLALTHSVEVTGYCQNCQ